MPIGVRLCLVCYVMDWIYLFLVYIGWYCGRYWFYCCMYMFVFFFEGLGVMFCLFVCVGLSLYWCVFLY